MFVDLQDMIRHEVVHVIFQFEVQQQPPPPPPRISVDSGRAPTTTSGARAGEPVAAGAVATAPSQQVVRAAPPMTRTSMGAPRAPGQSTKLEQRSVPVRKR